MEIIKKYEEALESARTLISYIGAQHICDEIGITKSTLYRILRGNTPSPTTFQKIIEWYKTWE